jgi:hypothetical protein
MVATWGVAGHGCDLTSLLSGPSSAYPTVVVVTADDFIVVVGALDDLIVVVGPTADATVVVGFAAATVVGVAAFVVGVVVVVFESDPHAASRTTATVPRPSLVMLCMGLSPHVMGFPRNITQRQRQGAQR